MFPTIFFLGAQVVENISNYFLLIPEVVGNPTVLFRWQVQPNFQVGNVVGNFQPFKFFLSKKISDQHFSYRIKMLKNRLEIDFPTIYSNRLFPKNGWKCGCKFDSF